MHTHEDGDCDYDHKKQHHVDSHRRPFEVISWARAQKSPMAAIKWRSPPKKPVRLLVHLETNNYNYSVPNNLGPPETESELG